MRSVPSLFVPLFFFIMLTACTAPPPPENQAAIDHGRYLIQLSGCNDCHTEEFMDRGGNVPENEWLTGSRRGWHNQQGTTYAANLRLLISRIDEEQWLTMAHSMRTKAPMAWYRLRETKEPDLRAIYRYIRWLGPAGKPAPAALPAGITPPEPYIYFPVVH